MADLPVPTPAEFVAEIANAHAAYSALRSLYSEIRLHRPLMPEHLNDDLLSDLTILGQVAKDRYDTALLDWQLANAFRIG